MLPLESGASSGKAAQNGYDADLVLVDLEKQKTTMKNNTPRAVGVRGTAKP